jgi:hypothetical protein
MYIVQPVTQIISRNPKVYLAMTTPRYTEEQKSPKGRDGQFTLNIILSVKRTESQWHTEVLGRIGRVDKITLRQTGRQIWRQKWTQKIGKKEEREREIEMERENHK